MDAHDARGRPLREEGGRLVGLEGRLTRPFWGLVGGWAVLCGGLASNELQWSSAQQSWIGKAPLTLVLVLLLADLAWGSLWDLATRRDWFRLLGGTWPPEEPAALPSLPYTQPGSPGGRLFRGLSHLVGWWRATFWPQAGPALLGSMAAVVLAAALTLLLPERLRLLNLALASMIGLGVIQRRQGRAPLALQAGVQVGLSWLAGHAALGSMSSPSLVLSMAFVAATWGVLRAGEGLPRAWWLVNGGQAAAAVLLVWLKLPLLAGLVGLLLFGQVALQLRGEQAQAGRRMWPWLMAAMLVAALALR